METSTFITIMMNDFEIMDITKDVVDGTNVSNGMLEETTTENAARSLATSGDDLLNLFQKTCRGLDTTKLNKYLQAAWKEDPLYTLKIIFNMRDCRGGKGERDLFRDACKWMVSNGLAKHLIANFDSVATMGRFDDLFYLCNDTCENTKSISSELMIRKVTNKVETIETVVIEYYAQQLLNDYLTYKMIIMHGSNINVSLAAKWAPTEGGALDKKSRLAIKMAKRLKAIGVLEEIDKSNNLNSRSKMMKSYRKMLSMLREYLDIVEKRMCADEWNKIEYTHVPSVCMKNNKKAFKVHDEERFNRYVNDVKTGVAKVNHKQIYPHELVSGEIDDIAEEQWKNTVKDLRELGDISNSLVLSDVSGSMNGIPIKVSIALGLLISELSTDAFKNAVITFDTNPIFHMITGVTLKERVAQLKSAPWGGSTSFYKVFDLILLRAQKAKLAADKMPKRLYVISDMQFDEAAGRTWETDYQNIQKKYLAAKYEIPEIVFWNVNGSKNDFQVGSNQKNVAMVSGFSPIILKSLLKGKIITPMETMLTTLDDERYKVIKLAK